jgi:two-component system OmpR family response regulator
MVEKKGVSILIADDEENVRRFLRFTLEHEGYSVSEYNPHAPDAGLLRQSYDAVILDINMPGKNGFELRSELLSYSPSTPVIFITGVPDVEKIASAYKEGFCIFLTKPFTANQICFSVLGALKMRETRMPHNAWY